VEDFGRERQATDDSITGCMRFASCITKATDPQLEYLICIVFHGNNGYAKAHQYQVMRTMPNLFTVSFVTHLKTFNFLQTEYCQMKFNEYRNGKHMKECDYSLLNYTRESQ
jgi:hypothetical protein